MANGLIPVPLNGGTFLILFLVELGLVFTISRAINTISPGVATLLFLLYAALNGASLSVIFWTYSQSSIAGTFFITAGMFAAMSVYGFTTRRDLSRFGSLLFAALIGIVLASVVNLFWHNPALSYAVSYLGVLVFVGLIAFDTQYLKSVASQSASNPALASRMAIVGSLKLYLDFLNLFLFLLRIMGTRRSD